uniref:Guanine nucleotide-exchange factor SEC12 isoform X2 n=1 Tax=Pogona vitticeps TaxID=103695 RepID=A0ABM5F8A5_9SAUR
MAPRRPPEIYRAPFPLYAVRVHRPTGLALIAGGGGAAKTGIANGLHFLQLGWREGRLSASLLHAHDTETRATMTLALAGDTVAAGQDAACHLLRFRLREPPQGGAGGGAGGDGATRAGGGGDRGGSSSSSSSSEKGPRRRRAPAPSRSEGTHDETPQVLVETLHCVQTDTSPDALQKAVCFNEDHTLLATGGVDGFLRVWEFPSMKKAFEVQAHQGEIEDITLSPDNKVVTVGRDFRCCVWKRDQMVTGLHWNENLPGIPDKAYRYQACRFGKVEDQGGALRLYTIQIPYKRERRPPPCYITKWDGRSFLPLLTRPCGNEVISCLSLSDTGTFLGLGTVTGSVAIFIAFSLQRLYYVREAHGIVVTAVAFLPETPELLRDNEAALLSVAVDSRCRLHRIPCRRSFPVWLLLLLCAGLIVATLLLLQLAFPGFL